MPERDLRAASCATLSSAANLMTADPLTIFAAKVCTAAGLATRAKPAEISSSLTVSFEPVEIVTAILPFSSRPVVRIDRSLPQHND